MTDKRITNFLKNQIANLKRDCKVVESGPEETIYFFTGQVNDHGDVEGDFLTIPAPQVLQNLPYLADTIRSTLANNIFHIALYRKKETEKETILLIRKTSCQ